MPINDGRSYQSSDQGRTRSDSVASKRASLRSQGGTLTIPQNTKADRRRSFSSIRSGNIHAGSAQPKGSNGAGVDTLRPERSPFLSRDERDSDGSSDSDFDDHLPVTGFAVASNRRNADFHALFPTVDEGDYLIEDYGCALSKDILVQGRLYVSENHVCFHANIFGWVTDVVIPFTEVRAIEKKMTALVIPNAIGISTGREKYTLASFISRDSTYDVLVNIWRLANPAAGTATTFPPAYSRPASIVDPETPDGPDAQHSATQCACGRESRHYAETAMLTVLPSTPEKIYNLMFNSEFFRRFLVDNQHLRDIETSDWRPINDQLLTRTTSYIKPLTGSIGPKQTTCHIVDEQEHVDLDDYISLVTTTRTPDVPSGGVFSVKTRTCLTWAGGNATRITVTTAVEWTGKSWVKGIIDKSAIEGQKQYHNELERGMRDYIKDHPTEFGRREGEVDQVPQIGTTKPTEASQYAAATRRSRQDQEYTNLQWGYDSVLTGMKAIFVGLKALFETLMDMCAGNIGRDKAFMLALIAVLAASNIYTYLARPMRPRQEMADAIRALLESATHSQTRMYASDELGELQRILDQVELRTSRLRAGLARA